MSEYERPDRLEREPTVEDIRQLSGASTPHFAMQLQHRIKSLISSLPEDHAARVEGEREVARLADVAKGGERRGDQGQDEPDLPSLRSGVVEDPEAPTGGAA